MKRIQSNIVNIGITLMNTKQVVKDGEGKSRKTKAQGLEITQAVVNGTSAGCTKRTINGGQKSASINLDQECLADLLTAVEEILSVNKDN